MSNPPGQFWMPAAVPPNVLRTEKGDPTTWAAAERRQKEAAADQERRIAASLAAATPAELARRREELVAMYPTARKNKGSLDQRIRQIDDEVARRSADGLAKREKELEGLFGGKKRRKTRKSSKKSRKSKKTRKH